jgi:CRP-like cAMP-binding protein
VATVTALYETVALELKAQALQEIIHYNPAIGFELMRQITRRLVEQTNNNTQN